MALAVFYLSRLNNLFSREIKSPLVHRFICIALFTSPLRNTNYGNNYRAYTTRADLRNESLLERWFNARLNQLLMMYFTSSYCYPRPRTIG